MPNLDYINKELNRLLEEPRNESYGDIIRETIKDTASIEAKYNLVVLLSNNYCESLVNNNLRKRLREFYCADENINKYVEEAVTFNPFLGYIDIGPKSGMDMEDDCSTGFHVKVRFNDNTDEFFKDANAQMKRIKEVLTMMLMESKFVKS